MKPFFQLSVSLGFLFCLGLSSCGRISPSLNTNYGRVIANSETKAKALTQRTAQPTSLLKAHP